LGLKIFERIKIIKHIAHHVPIKAFLVVSLSSRIQSGSRVLMTKNLKKITAEKEIKSFGIKNYNLLVPTPRPP
jgi:hypothetical protein